MKPELLAPGGSLEKCRLAFLYGADAVYVGGKDFSLRGYARNLNREELAAASFLAARLGRKLYATVNVFARDEDLKHLPAFLAYLRDIEVHGLIVSDPGVLLLARQYAPGVPVHLSTQANTTNGLSVRFWSGQGVRRINLARELGYREIAEIRRESGAELEIFVHWAMCVSYSGRCLLSGLLNSRSANTGLCTQPCRWSYRLVEEKRPGQYFPIHEDSRGTYIFNSKDLCLLEELGKLMALGIDAFKIEGRMKGALYLASTIRAYRQAIDAYWQHPESFEAREEWRRDLDRVSHRPYTKAFLFPDEAGREEVAPTVNYLQTHTLAGIVRPFPFPAPQHAQAAEANPVCLEVRSRLVPGSVLEFLHPDGSTHSYTLGRFESLAGAPMAAANPNAWITFSVPFPTIPGQVVRTPQKNRQGG